MTARRLDAGPLLALLGSTLLLVSLFLDWYGPGLTAWQIFEVLDLVLATIAISGLLTSLALLGAGIPAPDGGWLPWIGGAALVIVVATLLDRPPLAPADGETDVGLWLALAGSACMAAGALLTIARISISFDVQARRTRVAAVDARRAESASAPASAAAPARAPAAPESAAAAPEPLIPPAAEEEPPPVGPATAAAEETTRNLPDLSDPHDATGTRVEEPKPRGRRRPS